MYLSFLVFTTAHSEAALWIRRWEEPSFLAFVFADDAKTEFKLTAPASTKQILLDPEETLLRR